jgi:hypothetical protein
MDTLDYFETPRAGTHLELSPHAGQDPPENFHADLKDLWNWTDGIPAQAQA